MEKLGRNDMCWCGSGKKYKNCHMALDEKIHHYALQGHIVPTHDILKTPEQIQGIRDSSVINIAVLDEVAKMCAPLYPICFMASRSAWIPSLVTNRLVQCHQVWAFPACGGSVKPFRSDGDDGAAGLQTAQLSTTHNSPIFFTGCKFRESLHIQF